MADGRQILDGDGKRYINSAGEWDICEGCCTPYTPELLDSEVPNIVPIFDPYPVIIFRSGNATFAKHATNVAGSDWDDAIAVGDPPSSPTGLSFAAGNQGPQPIHSHILQSGATNPDRHMVVGAYFRTGVPGTNSKRNTVGSNAASTTWDDYYVGSAGTYHEYGYGGVTLSTERFGILYRVRANVSAPYVLEYYLSDDENADAWTLQTSPSYPSFTNGPFIIRDIDSRPTIMDGRNYMRADNANGTSWPSSWQSPTSYTTYDFQDVGGLAGRLLASSNQLHFQRATAVDGSTWGSIVNITSASGAEDNDDTLTDACLLVAGSRIYAHWTTQPFQLFDDTPTCYTWYGYSSCYYAVIGWRYAVYESYSDNNGSTWSTPVIAWYVDWDDSDGSIFDLHSFYDGTDPHVTWIFNDDPGGYGSGDLYYDGYQVLEGT